MAIGGRLYTGQNAGVDIPSLDKLTRSQERMEDMFTKANELRLKSFKEGEKQFLEMGNVDLETYMSGKNMEDQANLKEAYNENAARILRARGGNFNDFTTQDWVELQKGRQALESAQAKWTSDLEKYKLDAQTMERDAGRTYDENAWRGQVEEYLKTGIYPEKPLPIKKKSITDGLAAISNQYKGEVETELVTTPIAGAAPVKQKVWANMPREQAEYEIKNLILSEPGYYMSVIDDFESLPAAEQAKWLDDVDKSGTIDETDINKQENKIIAWAQQYEPYLNATIKRGSSAYSNVGGSNTTGQSKLKIGNSTSYYTPPSSTIGQVGKKPLREYYQFLKLGSYDINLINATLLNNQGNEISVNKILKMQPVGYDRQEDAFVFKVNQNYRSSDSDGVNDVVLIKRADVPDDFWELEINVDGKVVKIKDLSRVGPATTPNKGKLY